MYFITSFCENVFLFGSFPIAFLTSAWLQMNGLTQRPGCAFNRHVADKGNIWNISSPSPQAAYGAVRAEGRRLQTSWRIGKLAARFAANRQNALAAGVVLCVALCPAVGPEPPVQSKAILALQY